MDTEYPLRIRWLLSENQVKAHLYYVNLHNGSNYIKYFYVPWLNKGICLSTYIT